MEGTAETAAKCYRCFLQYDENDFHHISGFFESLSFLSLSQTFPFLCRAGHRFHLAPTSLELSTLEGLE